MMFQREDRGVLSRHGRSREVVPVQRRQLGRSGLVERNDHITPLKTGAPEFTTVTGMRTTVHR
jgi:hypothetical protein